MAYSAITAGEVDADSPIDTVLMGKVKDNFIDHESRLVTGEAGGFPIGGAPTAGNYNLYQSPWTYQKTAGGTYILLTNPTYSYPAKIKVGQAGTYRVKFLAKHDAGGGGVGYAKLYKNGTTFGTERALTTSYVWYSEDLTFAADDTIEIWGYVTSGGTTMDIAEFNLCVAAPIIAGAAYA